MDKTIRKRTPFILREISMNLLDDIFWIKVILVSWLIIGLWLCWVAIRAENSTQANLSDIRGDMVAIQDVALLPISALPFNKLIVLSSLMECLIREESSGNPNAHNEDDPNGGSFGILQYQIPTFQMYCVDKYGLEDNIWDENIQKQCCQMMLENK